MHHDLERKEVGVRKKSISRVKNHRYSDHTSFSCQMLCCSTLYPPLEVFKSIRSRRVDAEVSCENSNRGKNFVLEEAIFLNRLHRNIASGAYEEIRWLSSHNFNDACRDKFSRRTLITKILDFLMTSFSNRPYR